MAIRAFLVKLVLVDDPALGRMLVNPLVDYLAEQNVSAMIMPYSPPIDPKTGLPDKLLSLTLVESSQLSAGQIESLRHMPSVTLVPAFRGNKPISELPASARMDIEKFAQLHGVPQSVVNGSTTMFDLIDGLAKHISPGHRGVATYFDRRMSEFG